MKPRYYLPEPKERESSKTEEVLEQLGWTRRAIPGSGWSRYNWHDASGNLIGAFPSNVDLKEVRKHFLANVERNFQLLTELDQAAGFVTM